MAFTKYLLSLDFNTKNIGVADRLQAQGQQGREGIDAPAASNDDWVGFNGVIIHAPRRTKTASSRQTTTPPSMQVPRPSMLVPRNSPHPEYKWDEGAQCCVWVGRN